MLRAHPSVAMIETAAGAFCSVPELDAVFVGGATTCLYIDDVTMAHVRDTLDVDCTVEVASYTRYSYLEELLCRHNFTHVIEEGAPLCRWRYQDAVIDIMPDDEGVIGFTNSWYREGREHKISVTLPSGRDIFIFPLEYFIASKIEAFDKRGNFSFYGSKDIEDIVTVLDGTLRLETVFNGSNNAVDFVKKTFNRFSSNNDFVQSIVGHVDGCDTLRAERILRYVKSMV